MRALQIKDHIYWSDRWSAEIGRRLEVADSSEGLFIFPDSLPQEEIMAVIRNIPSGLYRLYELEPAPEENCDVMTDSGACYRQIH